MTESSTERAAGRPIAWEDVRVGDTIERRWTSKGVAYSSRGTVAKIDGSTLATLDTAEGGVVAFQYGGKSLFLIDRPKPELPTEAGSVITVSATDPGITSILALDAAESPLPILYLAGPMSGIEDYNYPAFNTAATYLRTLGYTVLNPAENTRKTDPLDPQWQPFMRDALKLLSDADGVAYLPGSHMSRGAKIETAVAYAMDWPVLSVEEWASRATHPAGKGLAS